MTGILLKNPAVYFGDIVRFLHDDIFMTLYAIVFRTLPHAAAASAAAVAGMLLVVWLFLRAVFFALAWMKGETRV